MAAPVSTAAPLTIGIIGGSGKQGRGLALRWARAGHHVRVGSRSSERGEQAAAEYTEILDARGELAGSLWGGSNADCLEGTEWNVLCVPYSAHAATLEAHAGALRGRPLIDLTVPLVPPKVRKVHLPVGGAAALEAKLIVGDGVPMVAALHHVSSLHLADLDHPFAADVLVCGEGKALRQRAMALIEDLGVSCRDAGVLDNAVALEAMTPVLIHMNKTYGTKSSGIRITGISEEEAGG